MRVPIAKLILKFAVISLCLLVVSAQKKKTPSSPRPGQKNSTLRPGTHEQKNSSLRPGTYRHKSSTLRPGTHGQNNYSSSDPGGVPEDIRMDMILGVQNIMDDNNLASLAGRASFSRRKSLPSGNLFSGKSNDHRKYIF